MEEAAEQAAHTFVVGCLIGAKGADVLEIFLKLHLYDRTNFNPSSLPNLARIDFAASSIPATVETADSSTSMPLRPWNSNASAESFHKGAFRRSESKIETIRSVRASTKVASGSVNQAQ